MLLFEMFNSNPDLLIKKINKLIDAQDTIVQKSNNMHRTNQLKALTVNFRRLQRRYKLGDDVYYQLQQLISKIRRI